MGRGAAWSAKGFILKTAHNIISTVLLYMWFRASSRLFKK